MGKDSLWSDESVFSYVDTRELFQLILPPEGFPRAVSRPEHAHAVIRQSLAVSNSNKPDRTIYKASLLSHKCSCSLK